MNHLSTALASISVTSILLVVATTACGKSDAEITIEATREAEATANAQATATVVADEAKAQDIITQFCDFVEKRFKTNDAMSSIDASRYLAALDWIAYNADSDSEIALIATALLTDSERVTDGEYASWQDAYQRSGNEYVGDCKTASWKR